MSRRLLVCLSILLLGAPVGAVVPVEVPLQGMLRDNAGQPVTDGAFSVTFSLYTSADDAVAVWSESWPPAAGDCVADPTGCVSVQWGRFSVRLGTHSPLSTDLFATHGALWLGVSVEGEPELPRRAMGSTPYARHAGSAASLACSGCVEADHLSPGLQEALASATITAADLPGDGLDEVSGGMLTTEFQHVATSEEAVAIKDYYPLGVTSALTVPDIGVAMGLSVTVHVTNSDLSSLTVSLEDPAGTVHTLWQESGPGEVLQGTYPAPDALLDGDLAAWVGQNPQGTWTLTAIDHGFDNLGDDGEIVSWSVTVETQSNQKAQVTGDLLVEGSVRIGAADAPCDTSREGTVRYDGGAKRLYLCTGDEWIQLRGCSEVCVPPQEVACGESISNDCGNLCTGPGLALNLAQCASAATSTPCGQAVSDACGNSCGTTGSGSDPGSCGDPADVPCGDPVVDACGNGCEATGTYCASGSCTSGSCGLSAGDLNDHALSGGWAIKCTDWDGTKCRGPQIWVPSGEAVAEGWWNLNYWNSTDAENACQLFCELAGTTLNTCWPGHSPSSGDNPERRLVDIGESGSLLNFPTGPMLSNVSPGDNTNNMSVTCGW